MRMLIVSAAIAVFAGSCEAAAETAWKTQRFAGQCQEVESGNVDEGQDFIFRKCEGAVPLWLLYQEGTRLSVGFGAKPHTSLRGLSTERDENWPIQWGGTITGGKFVPQVAIVRFKKLDETKSTLFVFRLLENGNSCLVGEVAASGNQSAKARAVAEKAVRIWTCLSEPVPVTS